MSPQSDPAVVLYPDRAPRDIDAEAANAEIVRQGEIAGLLAERADLVRRRDAVPDRQRDDYEIVDEYGRPTKFRVVKLTAALRREQLEEELRRIEDHLAIVDSELAARGHKT
jgi:hypothetical protein